MAFKNLGFYGLNANNEDIDMIKKRLLTLFEVAPVVNVLGCGGGGGRLRLACTALPGCFCSTRRYVAGGFVGGAGRERFRPRT